MDPLQQLSQLLRVRRRIVRGVQQVAQLVLAGLELDQLGGERLDAPATLLLPQGAGLEGVQVAVDRCFGLADLAADRAQLSSYCLRKVVAWRRAAPMARSNRSVSSTLVDQ